MRRPDPGELVALAAVGVPLAADVWLVRRDCDTVSSCIRRSRVGRVLAVVLAAHLLFTIPHDPLTWLASRLVRESA